MSADAPGLLVAVEGIDGAGKTGLIRRLVAWYGEQGRPAVRVRRYMVDEITELWWRLVDADAVDQHGTAVIAAADYAVGIGRIVRPALASGQVVLADKYWWSHHVYFRARGLGQAELDALFGDVLVPDVLLHVDVPVEVALARLAADEGKPDLLECGLDHRLGLRIGAAFARYGLGGAPAELRHEHFLAHQAERARLYRELLPAGLVRRIDGDAPPEDVLAQAVDALREPVH